MEQRVSSLQGRLSCLKLDMNARCKQQAQVQPQEECKIPPQKECNQTNVSCQIFFVWSNAIYVQESDQQDLLGQLAYHLIQWVTKRLAEERSPDTLCVATFSLLAVLLPTFPVQYHHTYLQFICRALLHSSSKTVSGFRAGCVCCLLTIMMMVEVVAKFLTEEDWWGVCSLSLRKRRPIVFCEITSTQWQLLQQYWCQDTCLVCPNNSPNYCSWYIKIKSILVMLFCAVLFCSECNQWSFANLKMWSRTSWCN